MSKFNHKKAKFIISRNVNGRFSLVNPKWYVSNLYDATSVKVAQELTAILLSTLDSVSENDCREITLNVSWK